MVYSHSVTCEELIKAQPSIRLAGTIELSREERQRISAVTKTLAMRDECDCCLRSFPNLVCICVVLSRSSTYRVPAPVDYIFYSKCSCGQANIS